MFKLVLLTQTTVNASINYLQDKPWLALQVDKWCSKHILGKVDSFLSYCCKYTMHMDFIFCQKLFEKAKNWKKEKGLLFWLYSQIWILEIWSVRIDINRKITAFSKKIFLLVTVEKRPGVTNNINNVYILFRCPSKPWQCGRQLFLRLFFFFLSKCLPWKRISLHTFFCIPSWLT